MNLAALRANWRTSLSGIGAALFTALTVIAALPYQLGDMATIIPPEWKPLVVKASVISALVLKIINSVCSKDASVVGNGTVMEPAKVAQSDGSNKAIRSFLFGLLLPALLFSGCVTGADGRQHPDGPTIHRLLDAVSAATDALSAAEHPSPSPSSSPSPSIPTFRTAPSASDAIRFEDPIPEQYLRTLYYRDEVINPRVILGCTVVTR